MQPGDRVGLVGSNGTGKTTLLRLLTAEESPDSGAVEMASGCRVGYLPQDGLAQYGKTLAAEMENAFPAILRDRARLQELESKEITLEVLEEMSALEDRLHLAGAETMEARIERILLGLGFERTDFGKMTETFSGGWKMRIALAKLLLESPDLLLLDEPTNHLDLEAQQWMESFLTGYPGAFIVISHDRGFLDAVTNRTLHLHHGQLDDYRKPYSQFEAEAATRREQLIRSATKQQREIARVERFVERFRYKATKAKQVQSRIKALARIDQIELGEDEDTIAFSFPEPSRGPLKVAELVGINKRYGALSVLENLNFRLQRGEKVAVVGRNGRGKSTFARILAGVEAADEGTASLGEGVTVGWFAQHQTQNLSADLTVLECALEGCRSPEDRGRVRSLLGAFLFRGLDVEKKVAVLSGGEKNRLALVRVLLSRANLLILDEPTNHLDLASKTVLQGALIDYAGAVVLVAHDRDFLDPIVDHVFAFEANGTRSLPGNVSEYLNHWQDKNPNVPATTIQTGTTARSEPADARTRRRNAAEQRARLAPLKKKLAALEAEVATLEAELASVEKEMLDPAFFEGPEAPARLRQHREIEKNLSRKMHEWEQCQSKIEGE